MHQTIAIGDIHGCYKTLRALLHEANVSKNDRLICLGDIVDRGPRIREALDFVLDRPRTHVVLGNHEWQFIDYFRKGGDERNAFMLPQGLQDTLNQLGSKARDYARRLARKPRYLAKMDARYVFCHADWNWRSGERFGKADIWRRINATTHTDYAGPVIVHGHTPCPPDAVYERTAEGKLFGINLDGGCYTGVGKRTTRNATLRAMDIRTGTLYEVPCRD